MSRKRALLFDSGVGGLSILDAIVARGLDVDLDYVADNAWLPYGEKSDADLIARVPALLASLAEEWSPDAIILACNTASTIALDAVRARIDLPIIGVVPPIKPAALASHSKTIGVLATRATIARAYVDDLVAKFAGDCHVIRCGSSGLVAAAEAKLRGEAFSPAPVEEAIAALFGGVHGARLDVVALACTHFPLLRMELEAAAPRPILWLDSGDAISRRLAQILELSAASGLARPERAAFTDGVGGVLQWPAFKLRGFEKCVTLSEELRPVPAGV